MVELVSVLIPAYDAERWLAETIRSAVTQTWPNIEVIVVDDGSKDRTFLVAKAFEGASVKVVTQTNQGAASARNTALGLAQGTYIQWLDADDLLHPQKIAAQMKAAEAAEDRRVLLSGQFGTFYYRAQKATFVRTALWRDLTPLDYLLTRFSDNACFQTGAWLVSRELTDAAGPWTDVGSPDDDGEYFCRVVTKSTGLSFVREAKVYYRVGNPKSLANRRSRNATSALFASKEKSIRYLLALEDSPRTRAASLQVLQDWMFHACEYADVVADARTLAAELGGTLRRQKLKVRYKLIEWLFGYDVAFGARRALQVVPARIECAVDRVLYAISKGATSENRLLGQPTRRGGPVDPCT
jgi:glycosyltransferase involved in cell wall biosynthesis